MDEFRVTIRLGNDAMRSNSDVAEALAQISDRIAEGGLPDKAQSILDVNGNRVGQYKTYEAGELATPSRY